MRLGKLFLALFWASFGLLIAPPISIAGENSFVTVVNPVRISYYTKDIKNNLEVQYDVISKSKFVATWLFTYDALVKEGVLEVASKMEDQEFGLFLEVTPAVAEAAGVEYHETGSWHFANAIFLSGYTQDERKLLIDKLYDTFKGKFGYYPVSVGSWWSDSFSLNYIKEKYGLEANLTVSDQFSTDNYQVWGQYWSVPFYPSKYYTGIPASVLSVKLDVVNFQWAPRDPINGYKNSLYSTQDYFVLKEKKNISYFEKLIRLYLGKSSNQFGQVTVGLESDLAPESYTGEFAKQMEIITKMKDRGNVAVLTMKDFSKWYKNTFPNLSPEHKVETEDLLGENKKVMWYQSPNFRVGILIDRQKKEKKIFDFRIYHKEMMEPYYFSPNRNINLSIYIPSIFDETNYEKDVWILPYDSEVLFSSKQISIKAKNLSTPLILRRHPSIKIIENAEGLTLSITGKWISPKDGFIFKALSLEGIHFFKQLKFPYYLLTRKGWENFRLVTYFVSQEELSALFKLSTYPVGKVLVYNKECFQCFWHTPQKPAVFSNLRGYVRKYGKHPIVYDSKVLDAKSRDEAREALSELGVKYIYLTKYEDYVEKTPFSPGDLNIEKLYDNANAEIWRVKE